MDQYFSGSANIRSPTLTLAHGHLTHFQRLPGACPMAEHLLFPLTRPNYVSDISGMVPQRICFFPWRGQRDCCFCLCLVLLYYSWAADRTNPHDVKQEPHVEIQHVCVCLHAYKQSHIFAHWKRILKYIKYTSNSWVSSQNRFENTKVFSKNMSLG